MAMTYEEALSKVQKLLKLTDSPNANEAAAAAATAQAIMDKYNIEKSVAEAEAVTEEVEEEIRNFAHVEEGELDGEGRNRSTWRTQLAATVARHNSCSVFLSTRYRNGQRLSTVEIVGRPSDVGTTRYLFSWLRDEIERLAVRESKGMGKTWGLNFRLGCIDTISQKLSESRRKTVEEMRQTATANGTALVRVDNAIAKFNDRANSVRSWMDENMNLRKGQSTRVRTDYGARQAGRSAAESITIGGARGALSSGQRQMY